MTARETPLRDVMLKASVVMLALMVASKVMGYGFHYIFVLYFPKEVYGQFVFVWSMGLFVCSLMPNTSVSIARYIAYYRGEGNDRALGYTLRSGILLNTAIVFVYLSALYAIYAAGIFALDTPSFLFLATVMALTSFSALFSGIVSGFRRPEVSSFFNLLQNMLRVVAIAAAAFFAATLTGAMAAVALALMASTLLLIIYGAGKYGIGTSYSKDSTKELFKFGFYNIAHITANSVMLWAGIFLLQLFKGAADVAVFNVALLASNAGLVLFLAALQIFSPVVSEMFGARRHERISHLASYLLESFLLMFLPVFLSVMLFARQILVIFVKPEYAEGAVPLQVMSVGAFLYGIAMLFMELANAAGRPQVNAMILGLGAVVNIGVNYALIPFLGMSGAAVGTLASSLFILVLSYDYGRRMVRLSCSMDRIGRILLSSVASVVSVYAVNRLVDSSLASLLLSCAALATVYFLALIALKSLRREDILLAIALLEKLKVPMGLCATLERFLMRGAYSKAFL